ncbi:hypothetical protein HIM_00912 [Hirsutella minnesotensis 3608]|nr:hypothetical protein HIM_00912 [Hirsutella minnesotensis 3608]
MAARLVPANSMGHPPVSRLPELEAHLQELINNADVQINARLLDDVEMQLTGANTDELLSTLFPPLTQLIKSTAQDPAPLLSLATKMLSPLLFVETLSWVDPQSLVLALQSPVPGANLLALAVLHKAASRGSDPVLVASFPGIGEQLVRSWLESADIGVGERAAKVLGDLLEADSRENNGANGVAYAHVLDRVDGGQGVIWNLIFRNRNHVALIQQLCTPGAVPSRSLQAVTISQGRLLRLLPRLAALNTPHLTETGFLFPDLFRLPPQTTLDVGHGLLQWAALSMVSKEDRLMHLNLIDFFETFVSVMRVTNFAPESLHVVKVLTKAAIRDDPELEQALRTLPNRTIEAEAEALRRYTHEILGDEEHSANHSRTV